MGLRAQPAAGPAGYLSGARNPYLGLTCGSGRETDRDPHCARYVLRHRLTTEFADAHSTVPASLTPLHDVPLRVPRARSALVWLNKPHSGAALLRKLVQSGADVTHQTLDALDPGQSQAGLRATLVHLGTRPPRHEPLAALRPWLEHPLTAMPPQHRSTVPAYAQWSVLHQARRRAARHRFTSASATRLRNTIRCAGAFLTWLDDHQLTLVDLTQGHVDQWLTGPLERRRVRPFLRWAHQRRLSGEHDVRPRVRGDAHTWWSDQEHWAHLQRCLREEDLPLDVRAAGALMLLYGMPVSRITELTTDRLIDGDEPTMNLGTPHGPAPAVHRRRSHTGDGSRPPRTLANWGLPQPAQPTE
ncbi:hypothetical protein [Streptomyces syringium]|uniref:hypothetical protein n=1 Tax=Streptomyces syringium TaxID=76729 RepID=UPI003456D31F